MEHVYRLKLSPNNNPLLHNCGTEPVLFFFFLIRKKKSKTMKLFLKTKRTFFPYYLLCIF